MAFNTSAVIGIFRKRENKVLVHPQMDLVIEPADDIIVITEDEMTGTISGITEYNMNKEAIIKVKSDDTTPEHILILGWNKKAPFIINELNNYVPPGSEVEVLTDYEAGEAEIEKHCKNNKNLKCNFISGDTSDRKILDKLNFKLYKHVILLSYSDTLNEEEADAKTLITLLHLRDIMEKLNVNFSIVSEMLNIDNQRLARITRADDFIVSENIISMILTQLLENKNLSEVFRILFSAEGSEFYLKPADKYLKLNKKMNFYTVIQAVKQSNEIALGYRKIKHKDDRDKHFGVVLNPVKTKEITFEEGDKIIVLAD